MISSPSSKHPSNSNQILSKFLNAHFGASSSFFFFSSSILARNLAPRLGCFLSVERAWRSWEFFEGGCEFGGRVGLGELGNLGMGCFCDWVGFLVVGRGWRSWKWECRNGSFVSGLGWVFVGSEGSGELRITEIGLFSFSIL